MDQTITLLKDILGYLTSMSERLSRLEGRLSAMDLATGTEFFAIGERFKDVRGYMETMAGWHKDQFRHIERLQIEAIDTSTDPILSELVGDYLAGSGGEELRPLHVSMIRERLALQAAEADEGDEWKDGGD